MREGAAQAENSQPALRCRPFKGTAGTASPLISTSVTDAPTLGDTVRATQSGPLFPSRLDQGCVDLCDKTGCCMNRNASGSVTGLLCKFVISLLLHLVHLITETVYSLGQACSLDLYLCSVPCLRIALLRSLDTPFTWYCNNSHV